MKESQDLAENFPHRKSTRLLSKASVFNYSGWQTSTLLCGPRDEPGNRGEKESTSEIFKMQTVWESGQGGKGIRMQALSSQLWLCGSCFSLHFLEKLGFQQKKVLTLCFVRSRSRGSRIAAGWCVNSLHWHLLDTAVTIAVRLAPCPQLAPYIPS